MMMTESFSKSKIRIPDELVFEFNISEGDKFEFFNKDGLICMMPVIFDPQKTVSQRWPQEFLQILGSFDESELAEPDELPYDRDAKREVL
jgi:hypothetical protein